MPSIAAAVLAGGARRGNRPSSALAVDTALAATVAPSSHDPTLMGEVILNIRSMFRKRQGRPRSLIRMIGLNPRPASATAHARRASFLLPATSAAKPRPADAPASPPVKK